MKRKGKNERTSSKEKMDKKFKIGTLVSDAGKNAKELLGK